MTTDRTALISTLRTALDSTDTVEAYADDYYTSGTTTIDLDYLGTERIQRIISVLSDLDEIADRLWEYKLLSDGFTPVESHIALFGETIGFSRTLATDIRAAVAAMMQL